jgi:simple sugar transport system ATP-binding protein
MREKQNGEIKINGPKEIAHIPADRHRDGVVMDFSLAENLILGRQREKQFSTPLKIDFNKIDKFSDELIEEYDIRPKDSAVKISGLSGGNQQKAIVARELSKRAELIIVSHPTRGLDIKAAEFVHHSILKEKSKGKAILLVSSDLNELLKLSDKLAVMYNGELNALFDAKQTNEREIGIYMTGGKK